jgi:hypothetical protein
MQPYRAPIPSVCTALWLAPAPLHPTLYEAHRDFTDHLPSLNQLASLSRCDVLSEEFYKAVQLDCAEWIKIGTTKTAMVYGLGNVPVKNHE